MKLFAESLMTELEEQLKSVHLVTENTMQAAELAIKNTVVAVEKLKVFFIKYKYLKKKEEIEFFREIKPKFTAKIIYYNEIYSMETKKPLGSQKVIRKYYKTKLQNLKTFFKENKEFYHYCRTGSCCLDNKYFIRTKSDHRLMLDSAYFQADHRFSTSHDYKMAQILANEEIKFFLEKQLAKMKKKLVMATLPSPIAKKQKWTGSKVELVELIYALHSEGVFNNGISSLNEITAFFESVFNINLGQFHRVFLEIRNRKSDRTKFLNTLKNNLIIRMDDADEK